MRAGSRRRGIHILQAAVLVVVFWGVYQALGVQWRELARTDFAQWRPSPLPLVLSGALLLAVFLFQALLWRRIVVDLSGDAVPVAAIIRVYLVANLGRYIPGKLWQIAGLALLARRHGIAALPATAAAVLGHALFLASGALVVAVTLPSWSGSGPALVTLAVLFAGGAMLVLAWRSRLGSRGRSWLEQRLGERFSAALQMGGEIRPRDAAVWGAGYLASWVGLGIAFAVFVAAFVPSAIHQPRQLTGTVAASYLGGYLALFAPAGIGVREGLMAVLLATQIPAPAALLISIASRVWFTVVEVVPLAFLPLTRAPVSPDQEQEPPRDRQTGAVPL